MKAKMILGGTTLLSLAASVHACGGKMDADSPPAVGEQAQVVAQKKEWLEVYDENCQVCFEAFEQCLDGALNGDETDSCKIAVDACVRGGLLVGDGGTPSADNGGSDGVVGGPIDVGGSDDEDNDDSAGDGDDDSAGDDGDTSSSTGGIVGGPIGVGGNDDEEEEDDGANDNDDDNDGVDDDEDIVGGAIGGDGDQPDSIDGVDAELVENINACLGRLDGCIASGEEQDTCVRRVKRCVDSAIDEAFGGVCTVQRYECDRSGASDEERDNINELCADRRQFINVD